MYVEEKERNDKMNKRKNINMKITKPPYQGSSNVILMQNERLSKRTKLIEIVTQKAGPAKFKDDFCLLNNF